MKFAPRAPKPPAGAAADVPCCPRRRRCRYLGWLLLFLLVSTAATGCGLLGDGPQAPGSITGVVRYEDVYADREWRDGITLVIALEGAEERRVQVSEVGAYEIDEVRPGSYTLTVEVVGEDSLPPDVIIDVVPGTRSGVRVRSGFQTVGADFLVEERPDLPPI